MKVLVVALSCLKESSVAETRVELRKKNDFPNFLKNFDLKKLAFGRLWGLREQKNRVLLEKCYNSGQVSQENV